MQETRPISPIHFLSLGFPDKRTLHMCVSERRTLICETGKFIWIRRPRVGVSLSYMQDVSTGIETCPVNIDCQEKYGQIFAGTTYRSSSGLTVPNVTIPCMGDELQVNYLNIEYSCIIGKAGKMTHCTYDKIPEMWGNRVWNAFSWNQFVFWITF